MMDPFVVIVFVEKNVWFSPRETTAVLLMIANFVYVIKFVIILV